MYYYHINKNSDPTWVEGAVFTFGDRNNYLWDTFEHQDDYITVNHSKVYYDQLVRHSLDVYNGKASQLLNGYHYNPVLTLEEAWAALINSLRNCRESVFESVRKEKFSSLPSRKTCIWLLPENDQALQFWLSSLPGDNKRAFRVKAEGNLHVASQKWVQGGAFSLSTWTGNAINYWNGVETGGIEDEILFQGKIEVINQL